jgi:hypothetical protein
MAQAFFQNIINKKRKRRKIGMVTKQKRYKQVLSLLSTISEVKGTNE